MSQERKLVIVSGLFIAAILLANVLGNKLFMFFAFPMTAGVLAYPLTFLMTDIVSEIWGRKTAQTLVWTGFAANILMVGLFQWGISLTPAAVWEGQAAFAAVLGSVPRIVFASMVAYIISQTWDVWIFSYLKEKLPGSLWLRNNVGTITAQAIDSAIFLLLAFGGVLPGSAMWGMYGSYLVIKGAIALLDTPLCYLGVAWARSKNNE